MRRPLMGASRALTLGAEHATLRSVGDQDSITAGLIAAASRIPTVDSHQHLGPERPAENDLCRMITSDNYLMTDLTTAGLSQQSCDIIRDPTRPLLERWRQLEPFFERVKHGTYAQAILITLRDLYGAKRLGRREIEKVSARIAADFRKTGIFRRVLFERCNIEAVLTQGGNFVHRQPTFSYVDRLVLDCGDDFTPGGAFDSAARDCGVGVRSADDLAPAMDAMICVHLERGAVGFKITGFPWREPTLSEIKRAHAAARRARPGLAVSDFSYAFPLRCLFVARLARAAAAHMFPIAVHTGAPWTNRLDFRPFAPTHLIPLLTAFPDTRFDLYHAGIPDVSRFGLIGKAFPNVWVNLCWAHIISSEMAVRAIREWLDILPINKVVGFGGDYHNLTVPFTYGHLAIARQNIARALAERIAHRLMTEQGAEIVLRLWLRDNPRELYGLDPQTRAGLGRRAGDSGLTKAPTGAS